jgi:hypothetical protein
MKWNEENLRSSVIRFIAEKTLTQELLSDTTRAKQVLEDALSDLKFETKVSDIEIEDYINFLKIYYKSDDNLDFDKAIDISIVNNPVMIIDKKEVRRQWVCQVNGHSYVRTDIEMGNRATISWNLNEDHVDGENYLTDKELERLFWENDVRPDEIYIPESLDFMGILDTSIESYR